MPARPNWAWCSPRTPRTNWTFSSCPPARPASRWARNRHPGPALNELSFDNRLVACKSAA